jgi:hypothetical protein
MVNRLGLVLALAVTGSVAADTIYLRNGVRVDGVVSSVPGQEGVFKVDAGGRTMFYRQSEIDRIEKNEKTGHLDKEDILKRWEQRNAKLTEETGLTADQRRLVRSVMFELKSEDASIRIAARDKLKSYQEQFDAFGYLEYLYPELSPLVAPFVLQALAEIDPRRSVPLVLESAQANHFDIRATAIAILGRMRLKDSVPLIARGLVDFDHRVQVSAAYALATMGVREATPALAQLLTIADLRVSGAARQALETLWQGEWGETRPTSVTEWNALWEAKKGTDTAIQLASLEVLSPEDEELKQTYDSNH